MGRYLITVVLLLCVGGGTVVAQKRTCRPRTITRGSVATVTLTAFAFDVETKMLVNFTSARRSNSFGDYRKVGNLQLPFEIEVGSPKLSINTYSINPVIDPDEFERKKFCFDLP